MTDAFILQGADIIRPLKRRRDGKPDDETVVPPPFTVSGASGRQRKLPIG